MEKPIIAQVPESMARPFVYDYCKRWDIPFGADEEFEYGQSVLWMGAFYKGSLRAVIGLLVDDCIPDELYVYGFYGDGTPNDKRPIRALIDFLFKLPYKHMFGFVHEKNQKMLDLWAKYGGKVVELGVDTDYQPVVKVRGDMLSGRKEQLSGKRGTDSSQ